MKKPKFYITTTMAQTLFFFSGQPRLWKEKFDVCAIAAEKEKLENFVEQEGIRYKYMPMHREISLLSDFGCLFRFILLFIKERPYIVHGNTPKASMLSMLAARLTFRPVRIYMCHGLRYQTTKGILRFVLMFMEKLSCFCATEVLCVSEGVMKQLVKDRLCVQKKARVIRYGSAGGIDMVHFSRESIQNAPSIRTQMNIPEDAFVFTFVGRIVKDKGLNELVAAFNRLSEEYQDVYLVLVGPVEKELDPIKPQSEAIIEKNNHIFAVGRQDDVRPYVVAANAFVLPSYREGMGMVLVEANALGVPCIASDIIGCNNVIVPNINGDLVEPRNEDALYDMMKKWKNDLKKVKLMAFQSRDFVLRRYSQDDVRQAYYEEYLRLAKA